jgi:hypothetical protein
MTENITTQRYWEVCGIDVNSQTNHEHAKSGRLTPYLKGGSCEC